VFVLSSIAALDIAEGRVGLHDPSITEVLESHQVFGLAQSERTR